MTSWEEPSNSPTTEIFLAHRGLRDYLKEHSNLLLPNFHETITDTCLRYISLHYDYSTKVQESQPPEPLPHIDVASEFLEYAEFYWMEHYKLAITPSPSLDGKVIQVLQLYAGMSEEAYNVDSNSPSDPDESNTFRSWGPRCWRAVARKRDVAGHPIFPAARLELSRIVDRILAGSRESLIASGSVGKAASIAASTGNLEITQALLEAAGSSDILVPLRAAAEYGHVDIAKYLIQRLDAAEAD